MEAESCTDSFSIAETNNLVAEGWKNLALKNVQKAVDNFQQACSLLSQKYGDTSYDCAESLFGYGRALLEQSRIENGVLGNALQGIDENAVGEETDSMVKEESMPCEDSFVEEDETTAEEKEKISDEVVEAMTDASEEIKTEAEESVLEETNQKETIDDVEANKKDATDDVETKVETNDKDEANELEQASPEETEEDEEMAEGEETAEEEGDANNETAEVGTLQLAWEVLELSRTIYEKEYERLKEKADSAQEAPEIVVTSQELTEVLLKQADCLLKLGEVGVESETYDSAIEDYFKCKDILKKAGLSSDDRRFAEISYHLGMAYGYKCVFDLSKLHYEEVLEVVEARIKNCQKQLDHIDAADEKEIEKVKSEIESLSSLIPDVKSKIEDCTEEMKTAKVKEEEGVAQVGFGSDAVTTSESDPTTNNIAHLVRKKRKSDEDSEQSETKKAKFEEVAKESLPGAQ